MVAGSSSLPSAVDSVAQSIDTFQATQPRGQMRRSDIKRMLASLAVHAPEDPAAFLDSLVGNPQANERRPTWAGNDQFELKLSTSSTDTGGWSGALPAFFPNPDAPRSQTVLDTRTRRVQAFPDEVTAGVQARLQRVMAENDCRVGASRDEQESSEQHEVTGVQVKVSAVSVSVDSPAQPIQQVEEQENDSGCIAHVTDDWRPEIAASTSEVVDEMIAQVVDSFVVAD